MDARFIVVFDPDAVRDLDCAADLSQDRERST
jgi:hypothetical protein